MIDTKQAAPASEKKQLMDRPGDAAVAEHLSQAVCRLDRLLVVALLLLTFLLASFPVRNSDFWLHLATGRLLAAGEYTFGVDPFAFTTTETYWPNPSWLYDLLLYGLTTLTGDPLGPGGAVLVLLKALLVTGLVVLLLKIHRPDQGVWLPVICVGLGVLTLAPRIMLQPICLSFFFLGLTIYFLAREGKKPAEASTKGVGFLFTTSPRRLYALPVLFMLWVNLDHWFFLGPLTVGLYLVGSRLQQLIAPLRSGPDAPDAGEQRILVMVLLLGLAGCLLNPHHVHVFLSWPSELFPRTRFPGLQGDHRFAVLFVSPFEKTYFTLPFGMHVSGMAYFPLLLLGIISFWLTRHDWRLWRLAVWAGFALASVPSMLLIPFFAVVASPITALNLQDYVAARLGLPSATDLAARKLALANRLVTLTVLLVLLICTWPGWLHAYPGHPHLERRVGWSIEVDPSLKDAAYKLDYWRTQQLLRPEDRGFNLSPAIAHYCAWFCPKQQGFLDGRFPLFTKVAASYAEACRGLQHGVALPDGPKALAHADWLTVFREHGINHVILTGRSWDEIEPLTARLLADPVQWTPLFLDGRTGIFGWNDPKKDSKRFASLQFDLYPRAFGKQPMRAPKQGQDRPPQPRSVMDAYWTARRPASLAVDESAMLRAYFRSMGKHFRLQHEWEWMGITAAGLVGGVPPAGDGPFVAGGIAGRAFLSPPLHNAYLEQWHLGPPAALVLSVRLARQALAEHPGETAAYLAVAEATQWLSDFQENHWAGIRRSPGPTPEQWRQVLEQALAKGAGLVPHPSPWISRGGSFRERLRQVQIVTALHHGLILAPDSQRLHGLLADLYWTMNFYDVALEHLQEQIKQLQAIPLDRRSPPEKAALAQREPMLAEREKELTRLRGLFEMQAASLPPRHQAILAFQVFGLPRQALATLMREDVTTLRPEEVALVLYLHLMLGQADLLREALGPKQKEVLGTYNFHLFQTLRAASLGNYEEARRALDQALVTQPQPRLTLLLDMLQALTFGRLQPHLLPQETLRPWLRQQFLEARSVWYGHWEQQQELQVLRGLLALEVGDISTAQQFFRQALQFAGPAFPFASHRIAERYLEVMKEDARP